MRTREPWVHFSFSPSPIYLYRAMVRAVSPRSVAHMVAQCRFRPRAGPGAASGRPCRVWRLRRSCARYALRRTGVGTLCFAVACAFFTLNQLISVRFFHGRVTGWEGAGHSCARIAQSARIRPLDRPRARPLIISTRAPLILVAQRRGLPYLTYADRRAKLARPNLSLTWFSTGCEALAAVATFRVNMRSSVSRRATS